jgi:hypothetical protein
MHLISGWLHPFQKVFPLMEMQSVSFFISSKIKCLNLLQRHVRGTERAVRAVDGVTGRGALRELALGVAHCITLSLYVGCLAVSQFSIGISARILVILRLSWSASSIKSEHSLNVSEMQSRLEYFDASIK